MIIYGGDFDIPRKKEEVESLRKKTLEDDFWTDREKAEEIMKDLTTKESIIKEIEDLSKEINSSLEFTQLLMDEPNEEFMRENEEAIQKISKKVEEYQLLTLLNGPYDKNDCILEIHPGAGGTESCDWASMLYRMYLRWCEKKNFKITLLDYQDGEEAGIKSVSIKIQGENAYGYLKNEKGVHRLVRISPFDSNSRRHTSFASIDVTPEIEQDTEIEIDEKDLKIDVYHSSGAGGQ